VIFNHRTFELANDVIVLELTSVSAETAAELKRDCVQPALWTGELNPVADPKRAAGQVVLLSQFGLASLAAKQKNLRR
jgi:hypothetical protein